MDRVLDHRVVRRHDRAARIPEADLDPLAHQRLPEYLGAGEHIADAILELGIGGCHELLLHGWLAASSGFDAAFKLRPGQQKGAESKDDRAPCARERFDPSEAGQVYVLLR